MEYFSINILIVTYRQEPLIGRALDSILRQKEFGLNKIIVSDDCSPDNTWGVLQEYSKKYPDIIEPHQNEHNLGIYGNFEHLMYIKGDADLYYIMAGDDELCNGWFKAVQEFLFNNKIDVRKQACCIYSDWKTVFPSGVELSHKQDKVADKRFDILSLKFRYLATTRSLIQSKRVLEQYVPVDLEHGVSIAESMFEHQPALHSDYNYYCPYMASIYYAEIGFSTKTGSDEYRRSIIENHRWKIEHYNLQGRDRNLIMYYISYQEHKIKPSVSNYLKMLRYYISSIDWRIGFSPRDFVRTFVLNR